jgi:hypothetical protein
MNYGSASAYVRPDIYQISFYVFISTIYFQSAKVMRLTLQNALLSPMHTCWEKALLRLILKVSSKGFEPLSIGS